MRVSWAGLLERADCADSMLVKHYKGDNTNDFSMSDPLSVTTNSYIVRDVVPLQSYTYQVREVLINTMKYKEFPGEYFYTVLFDLQSATTHNMLCIVSAFPPFIHVTPCCCYKWHCQWVH